MKIVLDVHSDSDNSFSEDTKLQIQISPNNQQLILTLNNPDREIRILKEELVRAISFL